MIAEIIIILIVLSGILVLFGVDYRAVLYFWGIIIGIISLLIIMGYFIGIGMKIGGNYGIF